MDSSEMYINGLVLTQSIMACFGDKQFKSNVITEEMLKFTDYHKK